VCECLSDREPSIHNHSFMFLSRCVFQLIIVIFYCLYIIHALCVHRFLSSYMLICNYDPFPSTRLVLSSISRFMIGNDRWRDDIMCVSVKVSIKSVCFN